MENAVLWLMIFLTNFWGFNWTILANKNFKRELHSRGTVVYSKTLKDCPDSCTCPMVGQEICRECEECPRQLGEPCSEDRPCDVHKGFVCQYKHGDSEGICRESVGVPCIVRNQTYNNGETFSLDCRTQCSCQNGTYGCSSLCPQEYISPRGNCQHPRLVEVPEQCCREWMCDSHIAEQPPSCQPKFSRWSLCSTECGSGFSSRRSNLNDRCQSITETRICQTRRCQDNFPLHYKKLHHHLRRTHECKATHRLTSAVYLRFGPCRSRKRFRPKFCGQCPNRDIKCNPSLSTSIKAEFLCDGPQLKENTSELLLEYLEPGEDLWIDLHPEKSDKTPTLLSVLVQWVLKCKCESESNEPTSSTGEVILHRVHRTAAP